MAATERVVVLMTPEQKAQAQALAADAQLGLGEYMRRQTFHKADDGDEAMLRMLVGELNTSTARASKALDTALAKIEATHKNMAKIEAMARKRAMVEFSAIEPDALLALMQEGEPA